MFVAGTQLKKSCPSNCCGVQQYNVLMSHKPTLKLSIKHTISKENVVLMSVENCFNQYEIVWRSLPLEPPLIVLYVYYI